MSRTPLRVSFAGGGTDLPGFYRHDYGAVVSTAINKYIYVTIKAHGEVFDEKVRVTYSKSERVQRIDEVENDIARECLRFLEIEPPIYISTIADLPASTGLGGSSSFAVGLLNALHAYRGERVSAGQLAEEASHIEIDVLHQPVGKQDQYAAAYGGLNYFRFNHDGGVLVEPQRLINGALTELFECTLMFWTGHQRDSASVLAEQNANTARNMESLLRIREHAHEVRRLLNVGHVCPEELGRLLDESWQLKSTLASRVTTSEIDEWYRRAMNAGAAGGKVCGAGGGGFLLFIARPGQKEAIRRALPDLTEVTVNHEVHGSQVSVPFVD